MKAFTLTLIDQDDMKAIQIEPEICVQRIPYKTGETIGLPLGTTPMKYGDDSPASCFIKFFKVYLSSKDSTDYNVAYVKVSQNEKGVRYAAEDTSPDADNDRHCLLYMPASDPDSNMKFKDAKLLRDDNILFTGFNYADKERKFKDGRRFYPYSCPSVLVMDLNEGYYIEYWDSLAKKKFSLEIYFDGNNIQIENHREIEFVPKAKMPHKRSQYNKRYDAE